MNLFLDTSVILAACSSASGASFEVIRRAPANSWALITTPYVQSEVARNISRLSPGADASWNAIIPQLRVCADILVFDRPAIFSPAKDRPILFSAFAYADVLLTLDQNDFGSFMDRTFYGLTVLRPGAFLERERAARRLR